MRPRSQQIINHQLCDDNNSKEVFCLLVYHKQIKSDIVHLTLIVQIYFLSRSESFLQNWLGTEHKSRLLDLLVCKKVSLIFANSTSSFTLSLTFSFSRCAELNEQVVTPTLCRHL